MGDIRFWSCVVEKDTVLEVEQTEDSSEYYHITNVALGPKPAEGPHTIIVEADDEQTVIATLIKGHCYQHGLDLVIDSTVKLVNTGKSPVHISGYLTISAADDYDEGDDRGMQGMSDDDEDEDEDEDSDEAPQGVPLDGMDEDEDEDEDEVMGPDEDEDEEEEEEEEPAPRPSKRVAPLATTPAAKKAKKEESKAAPASAPPKVQTAASDPAVTFEKVVVDFMKKAGSPQTISSIGMSVKRPAGVPKLTHFFKDRASTFLVDASAGTPFIFMVIVLSGQNHTRAMESSSREHVLVTGSSTEPHQFFIFMVLLGTRPCDRQINSSVLPQAAQQNLISSLSSWTWCNQDKTTLHLGRR
eukprot:gene6907-30885_t